jgi:hypothetical protein
MLKQKNSRPKKQSAFMPSHETEFQIGNLANVLVLTYSFKSQSKLAKNTRTVGQFRQWHQIPTTLLSAA